MMEQTKLHDATRQKVFYVYGVPQDQHSSALLKNFFRQADVKEVSLDGNIAKVVVHDKESITTMREKFQCFEGHDLFVMPELFKEYRVEIDEEWIKLKEKYCPKLKTVLQGIGVKVSKTSDGVFLIGSLEGINKASEIIKEKVEAEILKSELNLTAMKMNGHGFDHSESGIRTSCELATEFSAKGSELTKPRPNGTTTEKSVKYAPGSSGEHDSSDSDKCDSNDSGVAAADMEANVRQSDGLFQGSQINTDATDHHMRNVAKSLNINGTVEMATADHKVAVKDPGISSGRSNESMADVDTIRLEDYQLQFVNRFYPDLYEPLEKHPRLEKSVRSKNYAYLSKCIKENSIDRLIKVIENPKSVTNVFLRSTNVLKRLTTKYGDKVKLLVNYPPQDNSMEIIGVPEDIDTLEKEISKWREALLRKNPRECLSLKGFQINFISSLYPDVFETIDNIFLVQKESDGVVLILGTPDNVDKLCKWIKEHMIDHLEGTERRMPTGVDENACRAILNLLPKEIKLHLEFPLHGTIIIVGLTDDINKFLDVLKTRMEETTNSALKNLEQTTGATGGAVGPVGRTGMTTADHSFNESIEGISSDADGRRVGASDKIHLQDCQWQFTEKFYVDVYEQLKDYLKQNHELKMKHHSHLLDLIKNNNIDRVEKVIENPKGVETSLLQRLSARLPRSLKVLVSYPSVGNAVEIIGLPEDAEQWWTLLRKEIDVYKNELAKKVPQASFIIQNHELKFIETFYSEVYEYIKGLHVQKESKKQICLAGTFDEMDKLRRWSIKHDIDQLESKVETMPTFVNEEECKEVLGSMQGQIKLCLSFPFAGLYEVIGFKAEIRKFQDELEQRDKINRKKLIAKSAQTAVSELGSQYSYGANSSSDKEFAFQTPLSSIKVKIVQGDLIKQKTEAIVNPCNGLLNHLGGAAKAIADAAGRDLVEDCRKYIQKNKLLNTSDVMHTRSGRLNPPIKHVLHACGPNAKDHPDRRKCQGILEKTFLNCFAYANNELHVDSLSVPAISSGTFGVPKDVVALCTWNALMQFDDLMSKTSKTKCLKFICFINIDQESTSSLIQTFKKHWNTYLFEQKSKVEAAESEGSRQPLSALRRSGSFSGTRSSFKDRGSANGDVNKDTMSVAKTKQNHDSEESKSVKETSLQMVPQIRSGPAVQSNPLEAKCCCVCLKPKKISYLYSRNCHHKCCSGCMSGKCQQCTGSTKMESVTTSARTLVQSPTGAKKENNIERRSRSPETVIVGNAETSRSRGLRRSASVGRPNTAKDVSATDLKEKNENKLLSSAKSSINDNQHLQKDDNCCICMDKIEDPKKLDCGHIFCKDCIEEAFTHQPKCPSCGRIFGLLKGNQPSGKMTVTKDKYLTLEGYRGYGAIIIKYNIPDGIQTTDHPNPGQKFHGTSRTAYLPGNAEGEEVCRLLQKAFDAKLIFTVGKSNTTGRDNVVIWNDIHHKTNTTGQYGYPDPTYLRRVKEELAAKGIKSDAAGAALPSSPVNSPDVSSSVKLTNSKTGSATGDSGVSVYSGLDENLGFMSLQSSGAHARLYGSHDDHHYGSHDGRHYGLHSSLPTTVGVGSSLSYLTSGTARVHTASNASSHLKAVSTSNSLSSVSSGSGKMSATSYNGPSGISSSLYASKSLSTYSSSSNYGTSSYNLRSSSRNFNSANAHQPYDSKNY